MQVTPKAAMLALAIVLLALVTIGTWFHAGHKIVPVSTYTGIETTQSLAPLRTDLYDYIEPGNSRVRAGAPLAFTMPAAFYTDGLSLKGGAVAGITLEIDMATWQPFALPQSQAGVDREQRKLHIAIDSNFTNDGRSSSSAALAALPPLPRIDDAPDTWLGHKLIGYRRPTDRSRPVASPLVVDGVDMSAMGLYAYSESQAPGDFLWVDCPQFEGCRVFFYYYDRGVRVGIPRPAIGQARDIVKKLIEFLDRHRVSTPPTSKFPKDKIFQ